MIGTCPEVDAMLGGVCVSTLLDTGSEVSTVTESWFKRHFPPSALREVKWLTLRGAHGLEIPYSGTIEADVVLQGQTIQNVLLLVVKDPSTTAMLQRKQASPALFGMNVLSRWAASAGEKEVCKVLAGLVARVRRQEAVQEPVTFCARVAGRELVCVPAGSALCVRVTGPPSSSRPLMAEPLQEGLPGGMVLVRSLVSSNRESRFVRVVNLSSADVTLKPRTRLALLVEVQPEEKDDVKLVPQQDNQTVVVQRMTVEPHETGTSFACPDFDGTAGQRKKLADLINKHSQVFMQEEDELGYTDIVKHKIRTEDDSPVAQPYRSIPPMQYEEVRRHIQDLLRKGIIQESYSPHAAPIVLVRKKDGSIRLCVDYRRLNAKTVRDAYPLPRILETFDALSGAQYFSTLDLASGYHQIAMEPSDQHKTAFTTPFGLFEFTRMPFGLATAPATFQRLMQTVMSDFLFDFLLVYLDDLLVYSRTFDEHLDHLDRLLTRIGETGMKLNLAKCHLLRREVTYLGHTISAEGIGCEKEKTEAVRNWPTPTTVSELRSFLGFASYYRRIVKGFARIAGPLHDLVKELSGGKKCKKKHCLIGDHWNEKHQTALQELKDALTGAEVLGFADFSRPFLLEVDASHEGLGAILSQEQPSGETRVVAYASRRLKDTEKNPSNYSSFKLELLALKWAVTEKFRHYLIGTKFTALTDNNPLVHLRSAKLGAVEQRWSAGLDQFDFTVRYRPGRTNPADALSRLPRGPVTEGSSTQVPAHIGCIQEAWCEQSAVCQSAADEESEVMKRINSLLSLPPPGEENLRKLQQDDSVIGPVVKEWPQPPPTKHLSSEAKTLVRQRGRLVLRDGVLYRLVSSPRLGALEQLVLPATLRSEALAAAHDQMGHQGLQRTTDILVQRVYWPGMHSEVKRHVETCDRCAMGRQPRGKTTMGHLIATKPLEVLAIDFTVLEPASDGRENVLVMTDVFTKFTQAIPTRYQKAGTVAKVLQKE